MNRIIINESDLTTNIVASSEPDIVYVPGFASGGTANVFEPMLCSSINDFEDYFGTTAPVFTEAQFYPGSPQNSWGEGYGFPKRAIPGYTETLDEDGSVLEASSDTWFAVGDPDPSYIYAKELISRGVQVLYERVNESEIISVNDMYESLTGHCFDLSQTLIIEKGEYSVKYITSGGYPTYEFNTYTDEDETGEYTGHQYLHDMQASCAYTRGDAVALIDHTDNAGRSLTSNESVFKTINNTVRIADAYTSYSAMFTPYATFVLNQKYAAGNTFVLPGSFAYLSTFGVMVQSFNNFLPVAGVARGLVPGLQSLHTDYLMSNSVADSYQYDIGIEDGGTSINPITRIRPYGFCIWGNRTLINQSSTASVATNYLNIRNLVSDVKKVVYSSAKTLMFEQNTDILWENFKSMVTPTLDKMVSGSGLSSYSMQKVATSNRTKLAAVIKLTPVYSVESFEITIQLVDDDTITVS